jgi:hypothetical protein
MTTLVDLASVIRSKNAGPLYLTLDVMLPDEATFRQVLASGVLSGPSIAALYGVPLDTIKTIDHPATFSIKVSFPRPVIAGEIDDRDLYGAQLYVPLFDLEVPE